MKRGFSNAILSCCFYLFLLEQIDINYYDDTFVQIIAVVACCLCSSTINRLVLVRLGVKNSQPHPATSPERDFLA